MAEHSLPLLVHSPRMTEEEMMGWAEASPSMPSTVSGEGENHMQEVSVTSPL